MDSGFDSYIMSPPASGHASQGQRGGKFHPRSYGLMLGARRQYPTNSIDHVDSKLNSARQLPQRVATGRNRSQLQASVDVYDEDSEYVLEDNDVFVEEGGNQVYTGSKTALQLDYPEIYSTTSQDGGEVLPETNRRGQMRHQDSMDIMVQGISELNTNTHKYKPKSPMIFPNQRPSLTEESNRYLSIKSGVFLDPSRHHHNVESGSNLVHQKSSESHDSTASYSSFMSQSSSQGVNSDFGHIKMNKQPKLQRTSSYEMATGKLDTPDVFNGRRSWSKAIAVLKRKRDALLNRKNSKDDSSANSDMIDPVYHLLRCAASKDHLSNTCKCPCHTNPGKGHGHHGGKSNPSLSSTYHSKQGTIAHSNLLHETPVSSRPESARFGSIGNPSVSPRSLHVSRRQSHVGAAAVSSALSPATMIAGMYLVPPKAATRSSKSSPDPQWSKQHLPKNS